MLAVLAKVKSPLRRSSDLCSTHICRRGVDKKQLNFVKDVTTSAELCGKVRGKAKKADLSEKKLVWCH